MTPTPATQRQTCATCLRPQSTCICCWITPLAHLVEVVILQHPLEVNNAKGSARLLHLCLPHSRMATGEVFAEPELLALLTAPFDTASAATANPKQAILLYPDTPGSRAPETPVAPVLTPQSLCDPTRLRLIVLDGTWRKSRKMLYCNPLLQRLPRLPLRDMPASRYVIRKAHRPDQLSTLEATCAALMQLECSATPFQPLLAAFDCFVAQQRGYNIKCRVEQ